MSETRLLNGVSVRTLLVLGRASNLPTVWSNCVAGWWLGGAGSFERLALLCLGASCLYIGGMYLNDAFDADFDRQHRRERPIPSGAISVEAVWKLGFTWMGLGLGCLAMLGLFPFLIGLVLSGAILVYDAIHKLTPLSPVLMAACRFWLVVLAAAVGSEGVTGLALWSAVALAAYIVGLSYVAKFESALGAIRYWPLVCIAGPVVIALFANAGPFLVQSSFLSLLLIAWVGWCLSFTFSRARRNYGRTVSGLLAGIVWVDLLAVCGGTLPLAVFFGLMFVVALLSQRFIPAT